MEQFKINKDLLIKSLNEGNEVILNGCFSDGEMDWSYEYWTKKGDEYVCSYDGEFSQNFNFDDLENAFNPCEAETVSVR